MYVVFGIWLVCKRLQFLLGRMLLATCFYLLNIFSGFRNQHFAEKKFGLLLLCCLLVKSENYDLLKYFQNIVICSEIWHTLKVSQDMEYIFCIFQRMRNLIFFPGWIWLKKGLVVFFFFHTSSWWHSLPSMQYINRWKLFLMCHCLSKMGIGSTDEMTSTWRCRLYHMAVSLAIKKNWQARIAVVLSRGADFLL